MKKFTAVLIICSLALAVTAMAKPEDGKRKKKKEGEQAQQGQEAAPAQARPHARGAGRANMKAQSNPAMQQRMQANPNRQGRKAKRETSLANKPARAAAQANTNAVMPNEKAGHGKKDRAAAQANTNADMPNEKAGHDKKKRAAAQANANANSNVQAATAPQFNKRNKEQRKAMAQAKKPNAQQIQTIREQHKDFHAQARPEKVQAVTFNQDYRIQGADRWQGERYSAFRGYHPERHDRDYYHSHYNRVELIGGGYYYLNDGYWYPAWGYAPTESYYAYDGPIYVGQAALPPDQVIANVQTALQEQGYYEGEVDGLLGPLTRQALTGYQEDNGLYTTAAIDEPTLDSLGMGG